MNHTTYASRLAVNQRGISGLVMLIVIGIVAGVGVTAVAYSIVNRQPSQTVHQEATSQPSSNPLSSSEPLEVDKFNPLLPTEQKIFTNYQRAIIGKTTENELTKLPNLNTKRNLPTGEVQFIYQSPIGRENIVTTRDGKAVYEQAVTVDPQTLVHPKLTDIITKYGAADQTLLGSKYFGPVEKLSIWASKGIATLSNLNTGEIDEIQTFLPTTVDDYLKLWGGDYTASNGKYEDTF